MRGDEPERALSVLTSPEPGGRQSGADHVEIALAVAARPYNPTIVPLLSASLGELIFRKISLRPIDSVAARHPGPHTPL